MNYKDMSEKELRAELTAIEMELNSRTEAKKREAIKNFKKAFTELRKYTEVYVSNGYSIYHFDEFEFD